MLVAADVAVYGTVLIAPRDSAGCEYEVVVPAESVYSPGMGNESESQTSNSPSAGWPSVYLLGQL